MTEDAARTADATAEVFADMSDEQALAWLDAGDYSSVEGVALTSEATRLIEEYASLVEVQGFELGTGFQLSLGGCSPELQAMITRTTDKSSPKLFLMCATGKHYNEGKITS